MGRADDTVSALLEAAATLRDAADTLKFTEGTYRYNPLRYAWAPFAAYVRKYGSGPAGRTLLVGMNPGPWGMAQTGIPFGDPVKVRNWMGVSEPVEAFAGAHKRVPIMGFDSHRREGSGARLYTWAERRYGAAQQFFRNFFVVNYFPLLLISESGKNITPSDLSRAERALVVDVCDPHLRAVIRAITPGCVAGIGKYAAEQTRRVVSELGLGVSTPCLLHPSPANPLANWNWEETVETELLSAGIRLPS